MKNKTCVFNKLLSLVLVLMLAIPFGILPSLVTLAVTNVVSEAELVANNYPGLSDGEKALLGSGLMVGDSYTLSYPDDEDLITVDTAQKTVEAATYSDGQYVWNPVGARIVSADGEEEFELDSEFRGSFEYDGNVYTVEVDYEVELEVSADLQARLLNGPYYIAKTVEYADTIDGQEFIYDTIRSYISNMYSMTSSTAGTYEITDPDTVAAITDLYDEVQNGGYLRIQDCIYDYELAQDVDAGGIGKSAYLYSNGQAFRTVAAETYEKLAQICSDSQVQALKNSTNSAFRPLRTFIGALSALVESTEEASTEEWKALDAAYSPLIAMGADDYIVLDGYLDGLADAEYHEDEIKNPLVAGQTTISKNINQFNVTATVIACYIADGTIDSVDLTELDRYSATFRILEGTTDAQIVEAIEETGIEDDALAAWGIIDDTNYDRTVAVNTEANGDINYTIVYSPKSGFSITYDFEAGLPSSVPYGYNLRLPAHEGTDLVYDYKVNGVAHFQSDVVKITEATGITRTEGKPWTFDSLGRIISEVYAEDLTEDEIAALSSVANKTDRVYIKFPSNSDNLVSVTYDAVNAKNRVVAENFTESGIPGVIWVPVSGKALNNGEVVAEFEINGGAGNFDNLPFDKVEVEYKTALSNISEAKVLETLNNVKLLADDAAAILDDMANLDELYSKLGQLDKSALNKIKVAVKGTDMSDESRAAVEALLAGCVDKTGSLYLYEYLTQYHADGLAYVYKNNQYLKIKDQADIVNENLDVIYHDPQLLPVLRDFDLEEYYQKFEEIVDKLSRVQLAPEYMDLVDTASPSIASLTDALENLAADARNFSSASKQLTLSAKVTAAAPGLSTVTVKVTQKDSAGATLASETDALVLPSAATLSEDDVDLINAMIEAIVEDLGIDTVHYETADAVEAGSDLGDNATFNITYGPKVYTVTFVTSGQAIGTTTFYFDDPTIDLPGTSDEGTQYEYTVCGKKITVSTEPKTFTFTTAQIDNGSYAEVNRETLDAEREAFLALVKALNEASASAGLLSGRDMIVSFIPFENAEGDMAVVLRLAPDTMSRKQVEDALMNMVEEIAGSDYNYIKMADEYIRYDSTASLQAIINVLLDSGVCIDTYINAVDETGDIIEWSIDQNYVVLGAEYVDGIPGKLIKVGNNARINDVEILGGYIMESDMVFSKAEDDPGKAVKLYVTFEDFNRKTQELKDARDAAKKVREHGNVILHDGIIDVTVKIPERGFQAYYAAMAVLDNERLWEGDLAEFDRAFELLNKAVDFLAADKTITTKTIENTAAKIDQDLDLSSIKDYFRDGIKAVNHLLDNVDYTIVNASEGIYDANFHYDINKALDKAEVKDSIRSIIKEKDTGVEAAAKVTFTTTAPHYQAIIGDYQANGWDKFEYTQNLGAAAPRVHDNTMILLLDDYTGDLVFNSIAYIDLNGHTINGNIISNSEVYILNDEFATKTDAGVTGTITGKATISGGRYNDDVSSKLEEGYIQDENGLVRGEYFFVYDKGDGNIEIHIDKEAEALGATGAIAYEIAFKYALHYYAGASLKVGDRTMYELKAEDLIAMYEGGLENAKDQIHDCVDEDAIKALGNDIKEAISDYVKDSHEVVSGEILATYPVEYNRFTFELKHVKNGDYITADIIPDADSVVAGGTVTIMAHEFDEPVIVEPYCTTDGSETYVATCSDCDYTYVKELEALGHDFTAEVAEEQYLVSAADCENAAVYYKSCLRCGLASEETFVYGDALGHDFVEVAEEQYLKDAADCENAAVYYKSCSRCGLASEETFVYGDALGHDFVDAVDEQYLVSEADCTTPATYYKSCSRCGLASEETFEYGEALGHDFVEAVEEQYLKDAADCLNAAVYYKSCSRCGLASEETFEYGEALGHNYESAVTTEPTCTAEGETTYTCSRCGDWYTEPIEKIPHTPKDEWEVSVEPTPTTPGEKVLKCAVCGEILDSKPFYYTIVPLQVVPGATVAEAEVDNEARIITIVTKVDAKKAVYNLKLQGAKNDAFTMTDEAFAAGNELQIKGVRYNRQTDALGVRYFVSERGVAENERTYTILVTTPEGETVEYTVNITFARSAVVYRDGVEPGVGADIPYTGFDPDDGDIYLVSLPGRERATFRLYLPKGASVKVSSTTKPHMFQIWDYNAKIYKEVLTNEELDPNWFVYFRSERSETENYEYTLCVTLADGSEIYHDVHVIFVD